MSRILAEFHALLNSQRRTIMITMITMILFIRSLRGLQTLDLNLRCICRPLLVLSFLSNSCTFGRKDRTFASVTFTLDWKPISPRSHRFTCLLSILVKSLSGIKILANAGNFLLTLWIFLFSSLYSALGKPAPPRL